MINKNRISLSSFAGKMFSLSRRQLSNKEIKEIISTSEWKWPTKEQLTLRLRMSVRCESEGANGPQFWIEQFCGGHTFPPRFFSRCKSTHFEALWIPPRQQHSTAECVESVFDWDPVLKLRIMLPRERMLTDGCSSTKSRFSSAPEVRQCSCVDRDFRASNSFFEFQVLV